MLLISCNNSNKKEVVNAETHLTENQNWDNESIDTKNIELEITKYFKALDDNDADKVIEFMYPDIFVYLKNQFPNEYSAKMIKDVIRESMTSIDNVDKMVDSRHYEFGEFEQHIDEDGIKVYTVTTYIIWEMNGKERVEGSEQLAISLDNGGTWKFVEKQTKDEFLPLLKISIPNRLANLVE